MYLPNIIFVYEIQCEIISHHKKKKKITFFVSVRGAAILVPVAYLSGRNSLRPKLSLPQK